MAIDGLNIDKAALYKLATGNKTVNNLYKTSDPRMSMTGSIFGSSPMSRTNGTPDEKNKPNLTPWENDNTGANTRAAGENSETNGTDKKPDGSDTSAAEGKALASEVSGEADAVKADTRKVQGEVQGAKTRSANAQKTTKSLEKDQKNLEKNLKLTGKMLADNQKKIDVENQAMQELSTQMTSDQAELESLLGADRTGVGTTSAFSLKLAGDNSGAGETQGSGAPDAKRINELVTRLKGNATLIDVHGKQIYSLQKTSSKSMAQMNKLNTQYVRTTKNVQKSLKNQNAENNSVIKFADKAEQISQGVVLGGQTAQLVGKGMILAGKALAGTVWGAAAGAALIAAGGVVEKVGVTAEMVGNYGVAAAGATKTVAYAAEGNLAGALTSAAGAMMAGNSAVKSTKAFGATMEQINNSVTQAKQYGAATAQARQIVNQNKDNMMEGMSKKAAIKSTREGILKDGVKGDKFKEMMASAKNSSAANFDATQVAFADAKGTAAADLTKQGVKSTKIDKKAAKIANRQISGNNTMANVATGTTKSAAKTGKDKIEELCKGFSSMASLIGNMQQANNQGNQEYVQLGDSRGVLAQLDRIRNSRSHAYA